MNTLDPNIFGIILSYLDNNSLNALNKIFPNIITASQNTNTYWHEKSELLLGKKLNIGSYNWKLIYNTLESVPEIDWFDIAIYYNNIELIKLLIDIGKDPSINNNTLTPTKPPIIAACIYGSLEIVKLLLSNDNVRKQSTQINDSLSYAAGSNNPEIVQFLLKESIIDPAWKNYAALRTAVRVGDSIIVDIFLKDTRVYPEKIMGYNLIDMVVEMGYVNLVELLLKDGRVNPSHHSNQPIILASTKGYTDIVKLLMDDNRVDPADSLNQAIISAINNGHVEIIELLLKNDDVLYNIVEIPLIYKNIAKNSIKGMIIGEYYTRHKDEFNNYTIKSQVSENILFYKLIRYIIIRRPTILQIIQYLTILMGKTDPWITEIKKPVYTAVYKILHNTPDDISELKPASKDLYYVLVTFFLLVFEPNYSYYDILNIIDYENYNVDVWKGLAISLIGAYIGFDDILKQNNLRGSLDKSKLIQYANRIELMTHLP
jgi:ankyrin repeat protein